MRKVLLISLFALLAIVQAKGAKSFTDGNLKFTVNADGTSVTVSKNGTIEGALKIPAKVTNDGIDYDVTSIGESAFESCDKMTSVEIPSSIETIGKNAFAYCYALTNLELPSSVNQIGSFAFSNCNALASIKVDAENKTFDSRSDCNAIIETNTNTLLFGCKNTTIVDGVESIGSYAFIECKIEKVSFPSSLTEIGKDAFLWCHNLKTVDMTSSIVSIGDYAFRECWSIEKLELPNGLKNIGAFAFDNMKLKSVKIPKSVTSIGVGAFSQCFALGSIEVEEGNENYDSREGCNAIIDTKTNTLIAGCRNTTIPSGVTSIWKYAFYGINIYSVTIPSSVTSIGSNAFKQCSNLKSVYVKESAEPAKLSIDGVFAGPVTVYIAEGTTEKYQEAWGTEHTYVECGDGWSLSTDSTLVIEKDINYENSRDYPWYDRHDIIKEVVLAEGVTLIGNSALYGCKNLTSIEIPEGVKSIGEWAFGACEGLKSVGIAGSVESIGKSAFSWCTALEDVTLAEGIANIGASAFEKCTSLTSITIPSTVSNLGDAVFGQNGLKNITSLIQSPSKCYLGKFGATIYIPYGTTDAYVEAWGNDNTYIELDAPDYASKATLSFDAQLGNVEIVRTAADTMTISIAPAKDYELESIYVDGNKASETQAVANEDGTISVSGLTETSVVEVRFAKIDYASKATLTFDAQLGKAEVVSTAADVMTISIAPAEGNELEGIYVDGNKASETQAIANEDGTISVSGLTETSVVEVRFAKIDYASKATLTFDAQLGKAEVVSTAADVMTISIAPAEGNELEGIYVDGNKASETQAIANEDGTISVSGLTENSVVEVRFAVATPVVNIKANNNVAVAGVYSLAGQRIGNTVDNLPRGMYIIVYTDGTSAKVLVK